MTVILEEQLLQLLRLLGEEPEPLFPSEITDRLNRELGGETRFMLSEVVIFLKKVIRKANTANLRRALDVEATAE